MSCFHPNTLFYSTFSRSDGKLFTAFRSGVHDRLTWPDFKKSSGCEGSPSSHGFIFDRKEFEFVTEHRIDVPCGNCLGCRQARARDWALRSMMELEDCGCGVFITLTYSSEYCPVEVSKHDLQKFLKRLRFRFQDYRLRYLACGEYGGQSGRPHYHLIVFGMPFDALGSNGFIRSGSLPLFTSPILQQLWPLGFSSFGEATFENCLYVAKYGVKSLVAKDAGFILMSRRPGLGVEWIRKHADRLVGNRLIYVQGKKGVLNNYLKSLVLDESEFERFRRLDKSHLLALGDRLQLSASHCGVSFDRVSGDLEDLAYKKLVGRVL